MASLPRDSSADTYYIFVYDQLRRPARRTEAKRIDIGHYISPK